MTTMAAKASKPKASPPKMVTAADLVWVAPRWKGTKLLPGYFKLRRAGSSSKA